jgi:hypothetical protein
VASVKVVAAGVVEAKRQMTRIFEAKVGLKAGLVQPFE